LAEATADFARPGARLAASSAAFVLAVAAAGYWWTGMPAALTGPVPQAAPALTDAEQAKVAEFTAMVDKLRERMEQQPVAEGLGMLGRSYLILGKPEEAVRAYERALSMEPQNATLMADMADAMGVRNGNSLSGAPMALIEKALKLEPGNLKALMLAGSEAYDRRDFAGALVHWQQMQKVGPADHPLVQQAALAVQETQREMGTNSGSSAAVSSAAATVEATAPAAAASDARITGRVALAPAVQAQVSPEDTVFIFARPAEGSRMPLAIVRRQVKDLPMDFLLDDSQAMSPATRLSSASTVVVGARISKTGNAMPQAGDWQVLSAPVPVGTQNLDLKISDSVR
jgi:cytochrome c-type biogenesis protein CcmH